jgi:hypothetical protein
MKHELREIPDENLFSVLVPHKAKCQEIILPWIRIIAPGSIPKESPEEKKFFESGHIDPEIFPNIRQALLGMDLASRTSHEEHFKVIMGENYPFDAH